MPPTLKFNTGFEHGISGPTNSSAGLRVFDANNGSTAIVTTGPTAGMISTRCMQNNTAGAVSNTQHTFGSAIASPATQVARFKFTYNTRPNGNCLLWKDKSGTYGLIYNSADNTVRCHANGTTAASGFAVSANTWYMVDIKIVKNTTGTCDAQITTLDASGLPTGAPSTLTQASAAAAAATSTGFLVGTITTSVTANAFFDDIAVSGTAADYPIGFGKGVGLYPNGDDSSNHVYSAATDFGKGSAGGTNLATPSSSETTSWQSLEKPMHTAVQTNFVTDKTGSTTEWLQWTLEDLPADFGTLNGLQWEVTVHSAATTAGSNHTIQQMLSADGNTSRSGAPWELFNLSIVITSKSCIISRPTVAPDNAAWDATKINDLRVRFLSSNPAPDVHLDGVCLEIDYTPPSGTDVNVPDVVTETGAALAPSTDLGVNAGLSTETNVAQVAQAGVGPLAGLTTQARDALAPTVALGQPVVGLATQTRAALGPQGGLGALAPLDTAAVAVLTPTSALTFAAALATATDAAYALTTIETLPGGLGADTASALTPQAGIAPNSGLATAGAAAYDATVQTTVAGHDAPAGLATANDTAYDATVALGSPAEISTAGATAYDATILLGTLAPAGEVLTGATAYDATASIGAKAELALASNVALDVSVPIDYGNEVTGGALRLTSVAP